MKTREIFLPREIGGEGESVFVSVNGRHFSVMKGVRVSVPDFVAEVLDNSALSDMDADNFIRENLSK